MGVRGGAGPGSALPAHREGIRIFLHGLGGQLTAVTRHGDAATVTPSYGRTTAHIVLLLYDSSVAVWSEGARVAPERPRAGRWVEGGRHAVGQAARGRSRGQRAALEGRAQTCWTWTWTWTWKILSFGIAPGDRDKRSHHMAGNKAGWGCNPTKEQRDAVARNRAKSTSSWFEAVERGEVRGDAHGVSSGRMSRTCGPDHPLPH